MNRSDQQAEPLCETQQANILIIDDTVINLRLLAEMLKDQGFLVRPVTNGKDGIKAAQHRKPDLILLDIHMPKMDGYEVCQRLKDIENLKDVPIIFISALQETDNIIKGFEAGGVDYIPKPFKFAEVLSRVKTHLQNYLLQRKYREARLKAELANTAKSRFLASMSHELRTPLNGIIGSADLLSSNLYGPLNKKQNEYMKQITECATLLQSLIQDLLDLASLETNRLQIKRSHFQIEAFLNETLKIINPVYEEKQLELKIIPEKQERGCFYGDKRRLKQVLLNLLTNAAKYSPKGSKITIEILITAKNMLEISVIDHGIGISTNEQARIFEEFYQVKQETNRKPVGTGIGLSISKKIIELHHGSIEVSSESKKGSIFKLKLPCFQPEDFPEETKKKDKKTINPITKVLIADENELNCSLLMDMLAVKHCEIAWSKPGNSTLQKARRIEPDILFIDLDDEEDNNLEVIKTLKEDAFFRKTQIIGMTSSKEPDIIDHPQKIEYNALLHKPVRAEELNSIMAQFEE